MRNGPHQISDRMDHVQGRRHEEREIIMTQIKTYGSGKISEAQRIANEERAKEKRQKKDPERRESLTRKASEDVQLEAARIVLKREEKKPPPDKVEAKAREEEKKALREDDEAHLAELMEDHKRGKRTFYTGMKMAFGAALRDRERSQETARIASRLGVTNPITAGVMGVGEASGVVQDRVRFVEAVCKRFAVRYRAIGHISADDFESPVGT